MYEKAWYEKEPSKMTEEEAKQAVAYWYGRAQTAMESCGLMYDIKHIKSDIEEIKDSSK